MVNKPDIPKSVQNIVAKGKKEFNIARRNAFLSLFNTDIEVYKVALNELHDNKVTPASRALKYIDKLGVEKFIRVFNKALSITNGDKSLLIYAFNDYYKDKEEFIINGKALLEYCENNLDNTEEVTLDKIVNAYKFDAKPIDDVVAKAIAGSAKREELYHKICTINLPYNRAQEFYDSDFYHLESVKVLQYIDSYDPMEEAEAIYDCYEQAKNYFDGELLPFIKAVKPLEEKSNNPSEFLFKIIDIIEEKDIDLLYKCFAVEHRNGFLDLFKIPQDNVIRNNFKQAFIDVSKDKHTQHTKKLYNAIYRLKTMNLAKDNKSLNNGKEIKR